MTEYRKTKQNQKRVGWALIALNEFICATDVDDQDAVADLLCNLMHLCQQRPRVYGEFPRQLARAQDHFTEEAQGHE